MGVVIVLPEAGRGVKLCPLLSQFHIRGVTKQLKNAGSIPEFPREVPNAIRCDLGVIQQVGWKESEKDDMIKSMGRMALHRALCSRRWA